MKIKKILVLSAAISSIACSSAFAKNGHSLSLEASRINVDQEFANVTYLGSDDAMLPTLGYGYKFEFNKFFIKPSVFYTFGDVEIKDTDGTNDKTTFTPSFSVEGDFGYDVTSKFGIFGTLGLMQTNYEREVFGIKDDASYMGFIFGAGVRYDIIDQLSLTAKYQVGQFDYGIQGSSEEYKVDTDTIRVGLSYNF
ncbi:porin family protein [Rickettsiales bacterium]|nr:porin family protein [Rickettsiales bacterium]